MARERFVFWSWSYALVAVGGLSVSVFFGWMLSHLWWIYVVLLVPAAIIYGLQRRARVMIMFDEARLDVRRGLSMRERIMLRSPPETSTPGPYRETEDTDAPRAAVRFGTDASLERSTPLTRGLGRFVRVARVVLRVLSPRMGSIQAVEHREEMARLSVKDAEGRVHHVLIPAQGRRNKVKLQTLVRLLGPATQVDDA